MLMQTGWKGQQLCTKVHKSLQDEGLLAATRSRAQLVLNKSEEAKAKINNVYFNPRMGISKYVCHPSMAFCIPVHSALTTPPYS